MTFERWLQRVGHAVLVGSLIGCGIVAPPMLALAAIACLQWWRSYRRGEA